jgi:uncharacterized membrane protein
MNIIPYIVTTSLFLSIAAFIEKYALTNMSVNSFFLIREIAMFVLIFSVSLCNKSNIIKDYKKLNLSTLLKILVSPLVVFIGLYIMYYTLQNSEKFNTNISIIIALTYGLVLIFSLLMDLFYLKSKLSLINIMGIFVIILGIGMCLNKS